MNRMKEQAIQFGKHDMERLGLFVEMPYMNGKGYVSPFPKPKTTKGRNIICDYGHKTKNGTQHGYFDNTYRRLFIGEAIERPPVRLDEDEIKKRQKKNLGGPFMPGGITKWHSTPGDHHGCFGGIIEAVSRLTYPVPPKKKPKQNFYTNPGKKGGPGYTGICLSKYPEHIDEPYKPKLKPKVYGKNLGRAIVLVHFPQPFFEKNPYKEEKSGPVYIPPKEKKVEVIGDGKWIPTGPAKWQGGCHAGMFTPYPEYKSDRDKKKEIKIKEEKELKRKEMESGNKFGPQSLALKTMITRSILQHNTDLSVNIMNYKTYEPLYVKHLVN